MTLEGFASALYRSTVYLTSSYLYLIPDTRVLSSPYFSYIYKDIWYIYVSICQLFVSISQLVSICLLCLCGSPLDLSVEVIPEENVSEGEVVHLYCGSCILSEALTYEWLKDGHVISSQERTNQLLLDPARENDTGIYSCRVKGHEGTPSHPINLTVTCK